jgi:hypothetical protein
MGPLVGAVIERRKGRTGRTGRKRRIGGLSDGGSGSGGGGGGGVNGGVEGGKCRGLRSMPCCPTSSTFTRFFNVAAPSSVSSALMYALSLSRAATGAPSTMLATWLRMKRIRRIRMMLCRRILCGTYVMLSVAFASE